MTCVNSKVYDLKFVRSQFGSNHGFVGFTKNLSGVFIEWIVPSRIKTREQALTWIKNQIKLQYL